MSLSSWRQHAPIGFVTVCIVGMLVIAGLLKQPYDSPSPQGGPKQYPGHTLDGVPKRPVAVVSGHKTPPANPEPKRNEWRQEQDLQAQLQMAEWAKYAALAAAFGVFVTAIGVWFVKQTLDATRTALGEAEKSSKAAVDMANAMVGIEQPIIRPRWGIIYLMGIAEPAPATGPYGGVVLTRLPERHNALDVIPFRNFGRTPAFPVSLDIGFRVCSTLPSCPQYTFHVGIDRDHVIMPEPQEDPFNIDAHFPINIGDQDIGDIASGSADLWLYFRLYYRDFLGNTHEHRFCGRWAQRPHGDCDFFFDSDGNPPSAYTEHK